MNDAETPDNFKDIRDAFKRFESVPRYFDKEGKPITLMQWAELTEPPSEYNLVKRDIIKGYLVSTVWLGLNHSWWKELPPLIFETMIFEDTEESKVALDGYQERYSTLERAIEGHEKACEMVRTVVNITEGIVKNV